MSNLFLGLDCSTQSLTGVIIDFDSNSVFFRESINFDKELPHYNTQNGIIVLDDEKVVHSYPLMWIEALELLFDRLLKANIQIKNIKAISGSGQQHGTVYLNKRFKPALESLTSEDSLSNQLIGCFSRKTSPIWMDSSTSKQCEEIRNNLGGMKATIKITGSNTFERFSGPQIRKFYQKEPDNYSETIIVHLVSSFMASVLLGDNAPIDHGDGAGMNLMNITTKQWDERAIEATAPNLKDKLPVLSNSFDVIGRIAHYFVEKYGFDPYTIIIAWSGDNPNSLVGVGLIEKGKAAISLGTSDTYFGYLQQLYLDLRGEGHVFGAPTGDYMSLICYKNGSLAREKIREKYSLSWEKFSDILSNTPPGNYGKIMLPYFFPEIVPIVLNPEVHRFGLKENDVEGNIRAIIESQFLSIRLHSEWIEEKPEEIYATGGASANREILQIAADIFNSNLRRFEITDSAALGAALRAAKSFFDYNNESKTWAEVVNKYVNLQKSELILPREEYNDLYDKLLEVYKKCEDYILRNGETPEPLRQNFIKKFFPN
jgi:xylulokinase